MPDQRMPESVGESAGEPASEPERLEDRARGSPPSPPGGFSLGGGVIVDRADAVDGFSGHSSSFSSGDSSSFSSGGSFLLNQDSDISRQSAFANPILIAGICMFGTGLLVFVAVAKSSNRSKSPQQATPIVAFPEVVVSL